MAISFQSATDGSVNRSVTVPTGTDRLMVVFTFGNFTTGTPTYNGVSLSVAYDSNDYVHCYYMLDPTEGSASLAGNASYTNATVCHYTGVDSFQASSGGAASTATISRTTSTANALIVFGIGANEANLTPATDCNERFDHASNGSYVGDRIAGTAGSYTVGVSSATNPDIVAAVFAEANTAIDVSGSASFPLLTADGIVYEPNVSGAVSFPALAAEGVVYQPDVTGAVSFPALQASGTIDETDARGAVTFPALVADGIVYQPDISGAVSFPALVASGSIDETTAQGAATFPALVAAGVVYQPDVSGAVSFPLLTASGSVDEIVAVTGAVSFPLLVAAGVVYEPNVSGAVSFPLLVALGDIEGEDDAASPPGRVSATATSSTGHARAHSRGAQATATVSRSRGRLV